MTTELGAQIPDELLDKLYGGLLFRAGGVGLPVLTVDPGGWPHVAMAPGAVAAERGVVYFALGGESRSLRNLERDGRVTLMIAAPDTLYYIKGKAEVVLREMSVMAQEAAVRVQVTQVLSDMEPFLTVTGGVSYQYNMMHDDFVKVIQAMLQELQSMAEGA